MRIEASCPAKVNLFLVVEEPDSTGYHPIKTRMVTISLADRLLVEDSKSGRDEITCNWQGLPEENTLTKALRFARELLPIPPLRIDLIKNIPAESGLGGGSSNAAALLRCLGKIFSLTERNFLEDVAFAVGADVPFFLVGGFAQAEHYGEVVTPLPDLPVQELLVIRPDIGVSTQAAYQELDTKRREVKAYPEDFLELYNDFERVAPCQCLELIEKLLSHGAKSAALSGSGSAVFGLFETKQKQELARDELALQYAHVFDCHTIGRKESLWMTS